MFNDYKIVIIIAFMYRYVILLLGLMLCAEISGQRPPASLRPLHGRAIPGLTIDAYFETMTDVNYEFQKDGEIYEKGVTLDEMRGQLDLSAPIWGNRYINLNAGAMYSFHNIDFDTHEVTKEGLPIDMKRMSHLWEARSTGVYRGSLWDKNFVIVANVMGDFSEWGFKKVTSVIIASMPLIKQERTTFGLGAVGLINNVSPWPVFPFVTLQPI